MRTGSMLPDSTQEIKTSTKKRKSDGGPATGFTGKPKKKSDKKAKKVKIAKKRKVVRSPPEDSPSTHLDLEKELYPIAHYIHDRKDMVEQIFSSLKPSKLKSMVPDVLLKYSIQELKDLCTDQTEIMSKKRILALLSGVNNDDISSSGTDDSSDGDADCSIPKEEKKSSNTQPADSTSVDPATDREKSVTRGLEIIKPCSIGLAMGVQQPVMAKSKLEILELEMRARAIKRMLDHHGSTDREADRPIEEQDNLDECINQTVPEESDTGVEGEITPTDFENVQMDYSEQGHESYEINLNENTTPEGTKLPPIKQEKDDHLYGEGDCCQDIVEGAADSTQGNCENTAESNLVDESIRHSLAEKSRNRLLLVRRKSDMEDGECIDEEHEIMEEDIPDDNNSTEPEGSTDDEVKINHADSDNHAEGPLNSPMAAVHHDITPGSLRIKPELEQVGFSDPEKVESHSPETKKENSGQTLEVVKTKVPDLMDSAKSESFETVITEVSNTDQTHKSVLVVIDTSESSSEEPDTSEPADHSILNAQSANESQLSKSEVRKPCFSPILAPEKNIIGIIDQIKSQEPDSSDSKLKVLDEGGLSADDCVIELHDVSDCECPDSPEVIILS